METKTASEILRCLPPGVFTTLAKINPVGTLQARRKTSGAITFYWRYSIGTSSERVAIGLYDPSAPPKSLTPGRSGYSMAAATRQAQSLALEHHQHRDEGGRPALLAAQRQARQTDIETKRRAAANSLESLLNAYCDHLEKLERRSHKDARSIFKLHVIEPWPSIATMPANEVRDEHFADMMRKLIDAGKGRTANKLRSYARAAYQTAKAARSKPSIPVSFKAYEVSSNPVAEIEPDEAHNRADKRPLSVSEMRSYWRAIKRLPGFKGSMLRLHLLTGGQRIEQLVRLRTADIGPESIRILDGKGRPGRAPRTHTVPLTKEAHRALDGCGPEGLFALSTDRGQTHVAATTLSGWASTAAPRTIDGFQAKRIRSGVETLLASVGVSLDIRGRLQSHGITGVQARHYDGHDYLREKKNALETLYKLLDQRTVANVTPITRRRA